MGVSLTVEVRSAVDKLRRSSPHPGSDPNPGTKPNGVHHAEAMPAGPEGCYVTVWFSEELTQEEREAVARAFEVVKARLSP